jgi:hypothetical protein
MYVDPYELINCLSIGYKRNYRGIVGYFFNVREKFCKIICLIYMSW